MLKKLSRNILLEKCISYISSPSPTSCSSQQAFNEIPTQKGFFTSCALESLQWDSEQSHKWDSNWYLTWNGNCDCGIEFNLFDCRWAHLKSHLNCVVSWYFGSSASILRTKTGNSDQLPLWLSNTAGERWNNIKMVGNGYLNLSNCLSTV